MNGSRGVREFLVEVDVEVRDELQHGQLELQADAVLAIADVVRRQDAELRRDVVGQLIRGAQRNPWTVVSAILLAPAGRRNSSAPSGQGA